MQRKFQDFGAALLALALLAWAGPASTRSDYIAVIDVQRGEAAPERVSGMVFHDLSRDGVRQSDEPGVAGVIVTNGRDVTVTDAEGRYALPVFDNMTVMVHKPAAWTVPVNANGVPQFSYSHKPGGTPEPLRYGGLAPTGPLPEAINFPMIRTGGDERFSCVMMGDIQTYSNTELGYVRDSILADLVMRDLSDARCAIMLGDVVGDDLGLLPRVMDLFSVLELPQYYIHGNHDFDFDATSDAHSADTWRQVYGPAYYSFEIGNAVFVALDNVIYPCGPQDDGSGGRAACADPDRKTYNGRVSDDQMAWLEGLLAEVPRDKLVVLMHHIPFVSFADATSGRHQTDNVREIHALLAGRPAVSFSGHTHTFEYLAAGAWYQGWDAQVGVTRLPFDHIVGGAPSGNWFMGDFSFDGVPMPFARDGTPPGYMVVEFDGSDFIVNFHAAGQPTDRALALSFNTPAFRDWFETLTAWQQDKGPAADAVPPLSLHDLADVKLHTPAELAEGVWLTANFWQGERHSRVVAQIDDGPAREMTRTQDGEGEPVRAGAEWADPFAVQRQMTIGRHAIRSGSGDARAQGFEIWQGTRFGPVPPQAQLPWMVADSSSHLWRMRLPEDLSEGTHVITVTATDRHGRDVTDRIVFEIRGERPFPYWDDTLWQAVPD